MARDGYVPFFETTAAKGRALFKFYAFSVFVGICWIWVYRATHIPTSGEVGRWPWIGLSLADLWFGFYWILIQSRRWNPIFRRTFKHRLSARFERDLPGVDVLVCTADPTIEPPLIVINTVLSVMAYDYPPEKLSVYLSDDGGSELTFYALSEATRFAKHWLPFCRKFKVEPRSPAAYFSTVGEPTNDPLMTKEWSAIKVLYDEMKRRIENATMLGQVPKGLQEEHKGFQEWDSVSSRHDHRTILQIVIDGRDSKAVDIEGQALPTLVYLAREKRPQRHHNFKAGAVNALLRVSSKISNGSIILILDCDMYSNNSESVRDALCFFMDEEKGHEIAYVQYPQIFSNITKNDIYASSLRVIAKVELPGLDGNGGPSFTGTGCFHRREAICGKHYYKGSEENLNRRDDIMVTESASVLEETCKILASCSYEENSPWGKEVGVKYGCPLEDIITGLSILCRGWKSMYLNPEREAFLGVAPMTLLQFLVQHKRWSEGDLQIFLSRYCPFLLGRGRIPLKLQMAYSSYMLWAPNSLPTLYYAIVPPLCLLRNISLFPKLSSPWILPFAYVIILTCGYDLGEFIWCGGTIKAWWNDQRMWLYKRSTSYLFGLSDTILKLLKLRQSGFVVTAKVNEEEVSLRYERETMEFGVTSPMFTILTTLALLNLFVFAGTLMRILVDMKAEAFEPLALQIVLCWLLILTNLPTYQGLFFRKDKGRMPISVTYQSVMLALLACTVAFY